MKKLLLALLLLAPFVHAKDDADSVAATVIEMSGEVVYEAEPGSMKAVDLGQMFVAGDRLLTKDASSLQLVLADGSTLALGPNSELSITAMGKGGADSTSLFELIKGSLNAIIEKLSPGAIFEVRTAYGVAAVKGTQFEVSADEAESAVTVQEGVVALSDPEHRRTESVGPLQRCSASEGRLNEPFKLAKREAGEFRAKWERARMIHGQRLELMKAFDTHLHERKAALQARRASLKKRLKEREKGEGLGKKGMLDRRKAARERFEKAREEIKKERKKRRDEN